MLTQVLFSKTQFGDKVALENCILLIRKSLHKILSKILCNWFTVSFESHTHSTRWVNNDCINVPSYRTKSYGRYSITIIAIYIWIFLQSQHQGTLFYLLRTKQLKDLIIDYFLN